MKDVFCYHCTQRGHLYSECPERKSGNAGKLNNRKLGIRVFSLQHEEAPTVKTFAGTLLVSSHPAYALVDTGATHSCMSDEFRSACGLSDEFVYDLMMCVSTPLGPSSLSTRVV